MPKDGKISNKFTFVGNIYIYIYQYSQSVDREFFQARILSNGNNDSTLSKPIYWTLNRCVLNVTLLDGCFVLPKILIESADDVNKFV